ncbi:hypothetical protein NECAME_12174 [Necator americanus]|uniref:Uncharacterized protein n=1 Tax=Necator americanus TaxID=51031 RepID=W2T2F6_NECAM|nr:hypothetical protein NECAME_12174 [Necator americanus]ETN75744.1 hypothetical protein NECAME_12174 [Necator americanus]
MIRSSMAASDASVPYMTPATPSFLALPYQAFLRNQETLFYYCDMQKKVLFFRSGHVVGGRRADTGRLGAFITRVKPGSVADTIGRLRAGLVLAYAS